MTTVRQATLTLLRQLKMTRVFGNPGSTELPMFRDYPDDFDYVLGLQESVVLAMADGYAQATRNAALVNLHSSAGTGHALGNLFTAFKNHTPLVVTAGQQARSILPFEPFLYANRPTEFPRPFVKWAVEPARAADVPRAIARAYRVAMTPPFGPTFISIPIDDWEQPCEPVETRTIETANPGEPEALSRLATALGSARTPALVLGAGSARDQAWDAAIALAEAQHLPVYVAPFASRNVFPEDHPLFQGFLPANREAIVEATTRHDLVLTVGGPLNLYHTEGSGPHVPVGTAYWMISDNPDILAWAPAGDAILANTRLALEQLIELTPASTHTRPAAQSTPRAPDPEKLTEELALARIATLRPEASIVVEEAPSSRPTMQQFLPILRRDGFYTTASGGLGYGLGASIGVALARPEEKIIALLGDGSAMYAIQGLFTAAKLGVPISFLILNNGAYEALRVFGRLFDLSNVEGTDLSGLDFCALAKGQGLAAHRADTPAALDDALAWSFAAREPTLVDMVVQ